MALLAAFGIKALLSLHVETTPDVNTPVIVAAVPLPGAAPEDIETLVTNKIEAKVGEIEDIDYIRSSSWQNVAIVVVFFKDKVVPAQKFKEFRDKLAEVRPALPSETMEPIIQEISFDNLPMMFIGFKTSGKTQTQISTYAAKIKRDIETMPGVKSVVMSGAADKRIEVDLDPEELQKYGSAPLRTIVNDLNNINTNMPGGPVSLGGKEYAVRTIGKFETIDDFRDMVVGVKDGKVVTLGDIAGVDEAYPAPTTIVHIDGQQGVTFAVMKKKDYGTIDVADRLKKVLEKYPDVVIMNDGSLSIKERMNDLKVHAAWGVLLVVIVLFIALGFRVALVTSFALPMSFFMTFACMYLSGMTLNIVSLFALLLALGMMVDNSIVVCENIYRHISLGKKPAQAARDATKEVSWPIFSSTAAVVAAFLPMGIILTGPIGGFTRPIPYVVTFALISSLIVANFFNPMMCETFLKSAEPEKDKKNSGFDRFRNGYANMMGWCLKHTAVIVSMAVVLLVSSVLLVVFKVIGLQLFPQMDTAKFYIDVTTPPGSKLEDTMREVNKIERMFDRDKRFVNHYIVNIGSTGTRLEIDDQTGIGNNVARFIVDLSPKNALGATPKQIVQYFRTNVSELVDDRTDAVFIEKILGPPVGAPISIEVSGDDFAKLERVKDEIRDIVAQQSGVVDLKDDFPGRVPQILLKTRQDNLGLNGMTTKDVGGFVFLALTGHKIGEMTLGKDNMDVFLRIKQDMGSDVLSLPTASFSLPGGKTIKFSDLMNYEVTSGFSSIEHKDGIRTVLVEANVMKSVEPKRIIDAVKAPIRAMHKKLISEDPAYASIDVKFGGETMLLGSAMSDLIKAAVISLVLIYIVLLAEFRSTLQPLIILVCVPYALVGVIIGLLIMGYSFSILAGIGLLCLIGIVVNNGIIYIDFANLLQRAGKSRMEACIEACRTRLRPIIVTKATVILGIMPLAMANASRTQFWKPMCWAIIWGLLIATTLTLVIIPVSYYVAEGWRERYYARKERKAAH